VQGAGEVWSGICCPARGGRAFGDSEGDDVAAGVLQARPMARVRRRLRRPRHPTKGGRCGWAGGLLEGKGYKREGNRWSRTGNFEVKQQ
jgi:hypothetical protein